MEQIKLLIPIKAKSYYLEIFRNNPWSHLQPVMGDDNFIMLIIDQPIIEDIEKIAAAAEYYGFDEGFNAGIIHQGSKSVFQ